MSLREVVENLEEMPSSQVLAFCRDTFGAAVTRSVPSAIEAKALVDRPVNDLIADDLLNAANAAICLIKYLLVKSVLFSYLVNEEARLVMSYFIKERGRSRNMGFWAGIGR